MLEFVKKLLFVKQMKFENGNIKILGEDFILIDAQTLTELLKEVKDYKQIYLSTKKIGKSITETLKIKLKSRNIELQELMKNIFEMAGWGEIEIMKINYDAKIAIFNLKKSSISTSFGHSSYPVDHLCRGFLAGGSSAIMGKDLNCIETNCLACGDKFCRFIVAETNYLSDNFNEFYKKQVDRNGDTK